MSETPRNDSGYGAYSSIPTVEPPTVGPSPADGVSPAGFGAMPQGYSQPGGIGARPRGSSGSVIGLIALVAVVGAGTSLMYYKMQGPEQKKPEIQVVVTEQGKVLDRALPKNFDEKVYDRASTLAYDHVVTAAGLTETERQSISVESIKYCCSHCLSPLDYSVVFQGSERWNYSDYVKMFKSKMDFTAVNGSILGSEKKKMQILVEKPKPAIKPTVFTRAERPSLPPVPRKRRKKSYSAPGGTVNSTGSVVTRPSSPGHVDPFGGK